MPSSFISLKASSLSLRLAGILLLIFGSSNFINNSTVEAFTSTTRRTISRTSFPTTPITARTKKATRHPRNTKKTTTTTAFFARSTLLFDRTSSIDTSIIRSTTTTTTTTSTNMVEGNNNSNESESSIVNRMEDMNLKQVQEDDAAVVVAPKKMSKRMLKKLSKKTPADLEWEKASTIFKSQVLDESFINFPIRGSMVNVALTYPIGNVTSTANTDTAAVTKEETEQNETKEESVDDETGINDNSYLMPGTHKHLGGAVDKTDGCIYGVPANSRSILCIYPDNGGGGNGEYKMKTIALPKSIRETRMKWLRGILANGYLWAIPSGANAVLCVNVDAYWGRRELLPNEDIVTLIPLPDEYYKEQLENERNDTNNDNGDVPENNEKKKNKKNNNGKKNAKDNNHNIKWQWHGAGINNEKTAIYCIPSNACSVLKVDIIQKTTSLIPIIISSKEEYPNYNKRSTNKWYGGIVGADNCIYGIPYRSCAVLKIDSVTDTATLIGKDYGIAKYNWHGGVQVNGKIYAHPSHANTVLVINTNKSNTTNEVVYELPIKRADYDNDNRQNYKWLGGNIGIDGNIYCPACDTSSILKIDVNTDECTTFGFCGQAKNKWQGGVLSTRDGCVYCIPADGTQVLRIGTSAASTTNTTDNHYSQPIQLLGNLPSHGDKWQGGFEGKDGNLYFIPENGQRVLKVTPAQGIPKTTISSHIDNNGEEKEGEEKNKYRSFPQQTFPENDVIIELM